MNQLSSQNLINSNISKSNFPQIVFTQQKESKSDFFYILENDFSKLKVRKIDNKEAKKIFTQLNSKVQSKRLHQKKNWKSSQVQLVLYLVIRFCLYYKIQSHLNIPQQIWQQISTYFPQRSDKDCKFKILSLTAVSVAHAPWKVNERDLLQACIQELGMNWNLVSQLLYQKNLNKVFRTSKQCREHYMCFLKPNLKKGPWNQQEDFQLVNLYLQFGRKWSKITKFIQGRNQNSIKNRFFLLFENKSKNNNISDLLRKVKKRKQKLQKYLPPVELNKFKTQSQYIDTKIILNEKKIQQNFIDIEKCQNQAATKQTYQQQQSFFQQKIQKLDKQIQAQLKQNVLKVDLQKQNNITQCNLIDYSSVDNPRKQQLLMNDFESFEQFINF